MRRFLRARQHDLSKAKEMYANHVKWRKEFGVEHIISDFQFHERDAFLSLYPQGYHKTDKLVSGLTAGPAWHFLLLQGPHYCPKACDCPCHQRFSTSNGRWHPGQ